MNQKAGSEVGGAMIRRHGGETDSSASGKFHHGLDGTPPARIPFKRVAATNRLHSRVEVIVTAPRIAIARPAAPVEVSDEVGHRTAAALRQIGRASCRE